MAYFPGQTNYGIYPQSPGEGSAWEVNIGSSSGETFPGMEGIYQAKNAIDNLHIYGDPYDEEFDIDTVGGLGQPGGPELQGDAAMGLPVNIVQRDEDGNITGQIPGVRIGYGENSRVVTLEQLSEINQQRRSQGLDIIQQKTPGFVPEYVDESGATVDSATVNQNTDNTTTTPATSVTTDTDTDTNSGGGMREIRPGVFVPEGLSLTELLRAGHITKEIYDSVSSELRDKTPDELDNTDSTNTDMTPEQEQQLADLQAENAALQEQVDNFSNLQGEGDSTVTGGDLTGGDTTVKTGDSTVTGGDLTGGDTTVKTGDTDVRSTGGTGGGGGTGGNVTVNFEEGSGGNNAGYEKFFEMINSYIASGEPIEEGDVKGIYEQFIETSPQSADAIRSFLALDRPVSEEQAELKTDIYGNIIEDVREAQSPLMKSLTRRSDQLGAQAEGLMGPLSFLENRDATQAGYGQAVAGGRGLGNISEMLAGRQRAEQKNVNLNLAGNLLGQQRATAGLMADVESGIYSQMAPDIGLDFGSLLGISGVEVSNILGERQSTRAAKAAERGANIKLGIEAAPTVLGGIKTGYNWITNLGK